MIELTKAELLRKKKDLVEKKAKLREQLEDYRATGNERKLQGRMEEIQQFIDWINLILQSS